VQFDKKNQDFWNRISLWVILFWYIIWNCFRVIWKENLSAKLWKSAIPTFMLLHCAMWKRH